MRRLALTCPVCLHRHIDRGEWAARPHRTHLCETCGATWRPFDFDTLGVDDAQVSDAPAVKLVSRAPCRGCVDPQYVHRSSCPRSLTSRP